MFERGLPLVSRKRGWDSVAENKIRLLKGNFLKWGQLSIGRLTWGCVRLLQSAVFKDLTLFQMRWQAQPGDRDLVGFRHPAGSHPAWARAQLQEVRWPQGSRGEAGAALVQWEETDLAQLGLFLSSLCFQLSLWRAACSHASCLFFIAWTLCFPSFPSSYLARAPVVPVLVSQAGVCVSRPWGSGYAAHKGTRGCLSFGSPEQIWLLGSLQAELFPAFGRWGSLLLTGLLVFGQCFLLNETLLCVLIRQMGYTFQESKMNSVGFGLKIESFVLH